MPEQRRDVFQAIADPTRREIIGLLGRAPHNLNALADQFSVSRQAVSLHVKILEECGVVRVENQGRERRCSLQAGKLSEVADWLEPFRRMWEDRFAQLDQLLSTPISPQDESHPQH